MFSLRNLDDSDGDDEGDCDDDGDGNDGDNDIAVAQHCHQRSRCSSSAVGLLAQLTSHLTETALFWVSFLYSRQFRRSVMRLPVARWLCGPYLAKTSLAGSSATSGDVSTSTRGAVWSTSESLTRGD